jgi:adenine phosphoribosyltransferase
MSRSPSVEKASKDLAARVRDVADFPKPGVVFKDITPILSHAPSFKVMIDTLLHMSADYEFDRIVGIESRGFLLGSAMAYASHTSLSLVRKKGKLPGKTISQTYQLEYGEDVLETHEDAVDKGEKVLIVDDILATGGTAEATAKLYEKCGATVSGMLFFMELEFLKGSNKIQSYPHQSLIKIS